MGGWSQYKIRHCEIYGDVKRGSSSVADQRQRYPCNIYNTGQSCSDGNSGVFRLKQFTLPLKRNTQRPVVILNDFYDLEVMLDTGALFPVWVEGEELLKELGGVLIAEDVVFSGFGGRANGRLYKLSMLKVGSLVFPEFHIIACRMNLPCFMMMSATMFRHMIYEIDDYNYRFNVTIPESESEVRNLHIWDSEGRLHVACNGVE